ncbi:ABC transporter ATP-binding protein [Paenibacillus sp. FSL R7-0345]|uniref:ABC transporter ATP-binding protein n=1 Tax=unclassified Paenibacillus TaxID=185978 RepID=UPI0004F65379|nr:ABC transporter ATP-binding protein [Paenibacillus sp. FSL R7-0273]AIQ50022.1 iron dicitrate ABC transporter ATP-binding protein [Paenibacillus sp. FSL R7-0273]OMF90891.1 iron dicitrate ABC transporter ATP-binding protein [Paenibacillus sp. FSL R7-0273]
MNQAHTFKVERLVAGYENKTVIQDVSLVLPSSKISVIIGSNGCGKSTLLKTMARLIKPSSGTITIDGKPLAKIASKPLARTVGMLPQSPIVPEGISVADLVGRGRFPHQSLFGSWSKKDYEAVAEAMEIMKITEFANHHIDELSGGQRQRVWIAMALAQQTDILFLDEPTTFLDITYQVEILDLLTDLNRKHGTTIVMVLHDINLSARYADHIFALHSGKLVAEGTPDKVITSTLVKDIFGLDCAVIKDPVAGSPMIVPKGRYHADYVPVP